MFCKMTHENNLLQKIDLKGLLITLDLENR